MLSASVFPISVVVLMTSSLVCIYAISVAKGDVAAFWPYISDGGVLYPESNVFAQLLGMSAFAAFCTFCVRFEMFRNALNRDAHRHASNIATAAFLVGSLSLFGMTLVGNFQEDKPDKIHSVGALLLFLLGTVYSILDTILSFLANQSFATANAFNSRVTCFVRFTIAALSTIFFVLTLVGKFVSEMIWNDSFPHQNETDRGRKQRHWSSNNPGYSIHVLGSTSEWAVGVLFIAYFVTLIDEFRRYSFGLSVNCRGGVIRSETSAPDESSPLLHGPRAVI